MSVGINGTKIRSFLGGLYVKTIIVRFILYSYVILLLNILHAVVGTFPTVYW